jgi:hypothetical protein
VSRVRLSLSHRDSEASPSCVLGLLLTLSSNLAAILIYRFVFCLFLSLDGFCFHQATILCLAAVSALIPIAQMKPNSSRPSAVMIFAPECHGP